MTAYRVSSEADFLNQWSAAARVILDIVERYEEGKPWLFQECGAAYDGTTLTALFNADGADISIRANKADNEEWTAHGISKGPQIR